MPSQEGENLQPIACSEELLSLSLKDYLPPSFLMGILNLGKFKMFQSDKLFQKCQ